MWREEQRAGLNLKGRVFQLWLYVQTRSVHHPSTRSPPPPRLGNPQPSPASPPLPLPALVCPCASPPPSHPHHPSSRRAPRASQGSVVLSILPPPSPPRVSVPLGVSAWGMGSKVSGRGTGAESLLSHQAVVHTSSRGPELPGQLGGVCGGKQMCPEPPRPPSSTPGRPRQHCPPAPSHVLRTSRTFPEAGESCGTPSVHPSLASVPRGRLTTTKAEGAGPGL